jgi:ankyrin repeat protein
MEMKHLVRCSVLALSIVIILASNTIAIDKSQDAKQKLASLKIELTEKAFLEQVNLGKTEIVRLFLEAGMSPNTAGDYDTSALHSACVQGSKGVVMALIDAKADVNAKDMTGKTALFSTVINGHHELIPILAGAGADMNATDDQGNTALHEFIRTPSVAWQPSASPAMLRTLEALISAKADVNAANEDGVTPLMEAASGTFIPMKNPDQEEELYLQFTKMLLKAGADPNAREEDHQATALMYAAAEGFGKIVSALIEGGADINLKTDNGATAYVLAKDHPEIQKLLDPNSASGSYGAGSESVALSSAQLWAIAAGGILARMTDDRFDTIENSFNADIATKILNEGWDITDHTSAVDRIVWLQTEGQSKDFMETHKLLSNLDNSAYAKLVNEQMQTGDKMMVAQMDVVRRHGAKTGFKGLTAWDQGRLIYVTRLSCTAKYLSTEECLSYIMTAAQTLQKTYTSWHEMAEHYMLGHKFWSPQVNDTYLKDTVRWLEEDRASPWQKLSWKTDLNSKK